MQESAMGYMFLAAGIGCCVWISVYAIGVWTVIRGARLAGVKAPARQTWPSISVVFAARDEEEEIGDAIEALLAQDYPGLEVIAVNDRSSDATGRIIDQMAKIDSRLRAVHVDTLPEGWLGKVNALDRGFRESDGEWVLFTDADVKLAPDTLKKAVTFAEKNNAEHLVLFPKLLEASYMLEVAFAAFSILLMTSTKAFRIGSPGSRAYIGVGAFNMVQRQALTRSEGFEWLKMEVGDDLGLGLLLRNAGAKVAFAFAEMGVSLVWYRSLGQMFHGMQKNLFSSARYSYLMLVPLLALLTIFSLSPLVVLLPSAPTALILLSALAFLSSIALGLTSRGLFVSRVTPYFLGPLGFMLVTLMIANSGLMCALRGGIDWRGTLYPLKALRKGQRVKL